jgi:hypothetical protein
VLATAAFVVWAVASSDGGGRTTTAAVEQPQAAQASPVAVRLANAIGRASLGASHRRIDMNAVAPFAWDRMYVFAGQTLADIRRTLGFAPKSAPVTVPNHQTYIVFLHGRSVAQSALFSDAVGQLDCLLAQRGYPRGTPFVVRFTRQRGAVLSTERPDAAERGCLNAVGVR